MQAEVDIANTEGETDALVVNALGGDDSVTATSLPAGVIKLIANFLGGIIAIVGYYALQLAPSLGTFTLITFVITFAFGTVISKGGPKGGAALLGFNATMVIFGLAILKGPENAGVWGARLVQFMIAILFAIGMMTLLLPRKTPAN